MHYKVFYLLTYLLTNIKDEVTETQMLSVAMRGIQSELSQCSALSVNISADTYNFPVGDGSQLIIEMRC